MKRQNKRDKRNLSKISKFEKLNNSFHSMKIYGKKINNQNKNKINYQEGRKSKSSKISSIDEALKKIKINNDTYKRMKSLYEKYSFYTNKIKMENIQVKENQNLFDNHSKYDLVNVISFVKKTYNNTITQKEEQSN